MSAQVVLLRDGRWPAVPGVCCWRHGVREAFATAGGSVREITWTPFPALETAEQEPPSPRVEGARAPWLPPAVRKPLGRAVDRSQRAARELRRRSHGRTAARRPLPAGVADADLVIAESLQLADDLLARGVPGRRIWVLALPLERIPGPPAPSLRSMPPSLLQMGTVSTQLAFIDAVADVAERVGGVLTDSETARSSLERAAARSRVRVELFPPVVGDRPCPECVDAGVENDPTRLPAAPWQLATWRALLRQDQGVPTPYSFAAARLRGFGGPWRPVARRDWRHEVPESTLASIEDADARAAWSAQRQDDTARLLLHSVAPEPASPRDRGEVLITGFDLKFVRELAERLSRRSDLSLTIDEWPDVAAPSPRTARLLENARTVLAEWARPNAVRISRSKRPDQMLIVRLHRFEMESPYPPRIAIDNVDAVVYIAPLFGRRIRDELGWPVEKLVYIPNYVNLAWLDRPKLPDARFTLGMVGVHGEIKRIDLALDILAAVRRVDLRYTLRVRGDMPWENPYHWAKNHERDYAGWWAERIERDPLLRDAVIFDRSGRDMARWYRKVGYILSPSDFEGSHASVAEGMGSGAVPVVRPWPGAAELYDKQWLHFSAAQAAEAVLAGADEATWAQQSVQARAEILRSHDSEAVVAAWADLLHGDIAAARRYFEPYTSL